MTLLGKKLNLASLLGALVVFLLPWLDMQCNGRSMVTQTGLQTIHGGGSLSAEMQSLAEMGGGETSGKSNRSGFSEDDRPSAAFLAAGSLLLILLALFMAVRSAMSPASVDPAHVALLATLALGLFGMQMLFGFPLETTAQQAMTEAQAGADKTGIDNPFAGLGAAMVRIQVIRQPWLWLELALLAVPGLLWLNDRINRRNSAA